MRSNSYFSVMEFEIGYTDKEIPLRRKHLACAFSKRKKPTGNGWFLEKLFFENKLTSPFYLILLRIIRDKEE